VRLTGSQYQCMACAEHFAGPVAFALHRTGQYEPVYAQCLWVPEMHAAGMTLNRAGFWAAPPPREAAA
jgi:hypothetical protein